MIGDARRVNPERSQLVAPGHGGSPILERTDGLPPVKPRIADRHRRLFGGATQEAKTSHAHEGTRTRRGVSTCAVPIDERPAPWQEVRGMGRKQRSDADVHSAGARQARIHRPDRKRRGGSGSSDARTKRAPQGVPSECQAGHRGAPISVGEGHCLRQNRSRIQRPSPIPSCGLRSTWPDVLKHLSQRTDEFGCPHACPVACGLSSSCRSS
jgi:hypothetical protein